MKTAPAIDAARLALLLNELRLPSFKIAWPQFTEQADRECWPGARLLATLAEHEVAERARRGIERHLLKARLPPGKSLESFDFNAASLPAETLHIGSRGGRASAAGKVASTVTRSISV